MRSVQPGWGAVGSIHPREGGERISGFADEINCDRRVMPLGSEEMPLSRYCPGDRGEPWQDLGLSANPGQTACPSRRSGELQPHMSGIKRRIHASNSMTREGISAPMPEVGWSRRRAKGATM